MKYGFIGAGNIAYSVMRGIIESDIAKPNDIYIYDINATRIEELEGYLNIKPVDSIRELVEVADMVFLAVKPNILEKVLTEICDVYSDLFLVSIVAGKTISFITETLGREVPIVRVMPNVNASIGESMTWICANPLATAEQKKSVIDCFSAIGKVIEINEAQQAVYTTLGSSSPAFAYLFIESLAKAAHKSGVDKKTAIKVAAQAVMGSAKMILESEDHAWTLIDKVCSPGGMTIEGIAALEEKAFQSVVVNAFDTAMHKAEKL